MRTNATELPVLFYAACEMITLGFERVLCSLKSPIEFGEVDFQMIGEDEEGSPAFINVKLLSLSYEQCNDKDYAVFLHYRYQDAVVSEMIDELTLNELYDLSVCVEHKLKQDAGVETNLSKL